MVFFDPRTDILIAALLLSVISQIIQRKIGNRKQMLQNQQKMRGQQKRIKELSQKQDKQSKQELEKTEKELMETMSTTMQHSLKQMAISTPVFLIAFVFLSIEYSNAVIKLPFPVPWFGENGIQLFNETNWIGWYVLAAIIISIILSIGINFYEKTKEKKLEN